MEKWISTWGIGSSSLNHLLTVGLTFIVALAVAFLVYIVARKYLSWLIHKIAAHTPTQWDDYLFSQALFNRLSVMLFCVVLLAGLDGLEGKFVRYVHNTLTFALPFIIVYFITEVIYGFNRIYESYPISRNRPLKVFIQLIVIFLYCTAILTVISIFTKQNLATLLAGLTAFAAVLMLIFKDAILGFVAGIQLSANRMVHIGDWITMPGSGADGDVLEINLTTVKVQNWDKTITTIPTYKMVSESFTNWRGMFESAGRRIKRSIYIDVNSIHYLSLQEIERLSGSVLLKEYMARKVAELENYNRNRGAELDERRLTNVGTFREYLESWISSHPDVNQEMIHVIRQLQPTPTGLPLEIYCFSARQRWVEYERVQADIFDHVFAVMELFGLKAFQFSKDAAAVTES